MTTQTVIDVAADVRALETMLSLASTHGLIYEVVECYLGYRGQGDSIPEAARCALYDWDI